MNMLMGLVLAIVVPLYGGILIALWMDAVEEGRRRERSDIITESIDMQTTFACVRNNDVAHKGEGKGE